MKQSLQLRMGQQLSMTPQLQQAIKLLQLSSLDLRLEIQQTLYSNPLLELAEEIEPEPEEVSNEQLANEIADNGDTPDEWSKEIPNELPVDAQWDDIYPAAPAATSSAPSSDNRDFESYHSVTESLQDHLLWQLNLTPMSDLDRLIATTLIDNIDDNGFLETTVEELWQAMAQSLTGALPAAPGNDDVENSATENPSAEPSSEEGALAPSDEEGLVLEEVLAVLHRIQQFDPPGVAASDLSDCLLIQLNQLSPETPSLDEAKLLSAQYLDLVAERNFPLLSRKTGLEQDAIEAAIRLIQSLSPRPGECIASGDADYVVPDASVQKIHGHWLVTLNGDIAPRLCINQEYAGLVQRANDSKDNTFLRNNLQEARWFLRSLESRNDTLLRVSRCIVEMQQEFLEKGPEAMKPLVLADVAEQLELHESTISRVTTQKYLDTPRGIFELKYFFSSHVNTAAGGECSSTAIRAMLKRIIADEPTSKPLSDSKLATLLQTEGIQVARRTVAKYRESLNIPSSSDRKRFKQSH
ncbi:MAG: RNA polymerase factor sigma-54 [Gammaproteobacteria bacterium]|nr:RNA polymerase factor sigma-54 [Gammaproteobacteria bacterium]MBQ0839698.1 RNA polymerase factor sigma-54 [Gammaproteobacteria bacterium]